MWKLENVWKEIQTKSKPEEEKNHPENMNI